MDIHELVRSVKAESDRMIDAYQAMPDDAPAWLAAFVGNLVNPLHNSIADIIEYLAEREGFDLDAPEVDARILPFPQR